MEGIIQHLQHDDVKLKHQAVETILSKLKSAIGIHDYTNDTKFRIITNIINCLKDSNPKIILLALDCVDILLESYYDIFQTASNVAFDLLIVKFADAKVIVRDRAAEVMIKLINIIGLISGFEKLTANLTHKNARIKEQVLLTVKNLYMLYGDDFIVIPSIATKISVALSDSQVAVRQLATEILIRLYQILGDGMMVELEASGIRSNHLAIINDAINKSGNTWSNNTNKVPLSPPPAPPMLSSQLSSSQPSSSQPTKKALSIIPTSSSKNGSDNYDNYISTPSSTTTTSSLISTSATGILKSYVSLLSEGTSNIKEIRVYSSKDLAKLYASIVDGLNKTDDWEARIAALIQLQGLAIGDGREFDNFIPLIKGSHELLQTQIIDLRSAVSKEACKTVAVLAVRVDTNAFTAIFELLVPFLMKQLQLKVAVLASAADRCMRVVITSFTINSNTFPMKILQQVYESCGSKIATVRKNCLEYLCIVCALWKIETLDKAIAGLKNVIKVGIVDADSAARKAARQLFWILRKRSLSVQGSMDSFLESLEPTSQKHVLNEIHSQSIELVELLELATIDPRTLNLSSYINATISSTAIVTTSSKANMRPASAPRVRPSSNSTLSTQQQGNNNNSDFEAMNVADSDSINSSNPVPGTVFAPTLASRISSTSSGSRRQSISSSNGPRRITSNSGSSSSGSSSSSSSSGNPHNDTSDQVSSNVDDIGASRRLSVMQTTAAKASAVASVVQANEGPKQPQRIVIKQSLKAPISEHHQVSDEQVSVQPAERVAIMTNAVSSNSNSNSSTGGNSSSTGGAVRKLINPPSTSASTATESASAGSSSSSSDSTQASAASISIGMLGLDSIKQLLDDQLWSTRLHAAEAIAMKLQKDLLLSTTMDCTSLSSSGTQIEAYIDMILNHVGDSHQKVAMECMHILSTCIEKFTAQSAPMLTHIFPALFHRLGDSRSQIRDLANSLLNVLRSVYDPISIITALSPKMLDIPERMKTAVMQYLVVIVPHCGNYFSQSQNSWAFLGRMANLLGSSGSKPSATLIAAARRLLELVYNSSSTVILSQIAVLPLQQQHTIKRALEPAIPDIDSLVTNAAIKKAVSSNSSSSSSGSSNKIKSTPDLFVTKTSNSSNDSVGTKDSISSSNASVSSAIAAPSTPSSSQDVNWVLKGLQYDSCKSDKIAAFDEVKKLASKGNSDAYWAENCGQIVSLLLDAFNPALFLNSTDAAGTSVTGNESVTTSKVGLTGLTPVRDGDSGTANGSASSYESMHLSCKALLSLARHRGDDLKSFMNLLVSRLCQSAAYAPIGVILHLEQILTDMATYNAQKLIRLALPYTIPSSELASNSSSSTNSNQQSVMLLAMHVLCNSIKHLSSGQVIEDIEVIVAAVLPSLSSDLVDLRKAVIFLLVEMYHVIGDALYPYIKDLLPPQRKLLTIYIEKHTGSSAHAK